MSNPKRQTLRFLRIAAGFILVCLFFILIRFAYNYLWNFYIASREEYKTWYPDTYFFIFPLVKILPFLVLGIIAWLTRKHLAALFSTSKKWLKRNYGNVLLLALIVIIAFLTAEFALRKAGFKPGYRVYSQYFHPVDSLFLLDGFAADSSGIMTVAPKAREFICAELERKNCTYELEPLSETQTTQVYAVPLHYVVFQGYNYKSIFKSFVRNLAQETDTAESDFIKAVNDYVRCPINSDGFKSIEFKRYGSKRKSILLLGDSFTWGNEASNLTNGFADLLLAKGYVVYNSGIAGTDPAQYLEVARKYVPVLKPDFVVVNFYIGNDIMYFERKPRPYAPVLYSTNAGNLIACPEGAYFNTPEEAYQYALAHFNIPENDNRFNKLCAKTVLSTLVWNAVTGWKPEWTMTKYEDYYQRVKAAKTKTPYSDIQIHEIKRITEETGETFILTAIPQFDGDNFTFPEDYPGLFAGMKYHIPPVSIDDYEKREDGHYNDSGHAMHAAFIDSLIQSLIEINE